FSRDWSSDVCSSDLISIEATEPVPSTALRSCKPVSPAIEASAWSPYLMEISSPLLERKLTEPAMELVNATTPVSADFSLMAFIRSEERRVGNEGRV